MREKIILYSRSLMFLLAFSGVYLQISKNGWGMLTYYTILSNILVLVFSTYLLYLTYRARESKLRSQNFLRLKAGVTMSIMITFVVYHLLLAPIAKDFWRSENILCHYIVPLYFLLDSLVLDKIRQYRWFDPFLWTLAPLAYCGFALINGFFLKIPVPDTDDSPFPYFFVNVPKYGWDYVVRMIIIICIAYIVGGYLLYILKLFLGSKDQK